MGRSAHSRAVLMYQKWATYVHFSVMQVLCFSQILGQNPKKLGIKNGHGMPENWKIEKSLVSSPGFIKYCFSRQVLSSQQGYYFDVYWKICMIHCSNSTIKYNVFSFPNYIPIILKCGFR